MLKAATATRRQRRSGASQWVDPCLHFVPQFEVASKQKPSSRQFCSKRPKSNPVEQADNPDNPVEQAAAEAVQKKLDEQPSPVVEPNSRVMKKKTTTILTTACENSNCGLRMLQRRFRGTSSEPVDTPMPSPTISGGKTHHAESAGLPLRWHRCPGQRHHGRPVEQRQARQSLPAKRWLSVVSKTSILKNTDETKLK